MKRDRPVVVVPIRETTGGELLRRRSPLRQRDAGPRASSSPLDDGKDERGSEMKF